MSGAWLRRKVRHPWLGPSPLDHVLGDARLRDLKLELEQLAVDAWRAPKADFRRSPDQLAQFRVDLRSSSQWARLPTPVAAKAGPVPPHQRLGPDDRENLQDRWKPATQLDEEPAIMVGEPDATLQPAPQDNQLMSKHRVLSLKPQLRLEWRGQGRPERNRAARSFRQLRRFLHVINWDKVFGTHRSRFPVGAHSWRSPALCF
jgi:hypothetical protein